MSETIGSDVNAAPSEQEVLDKIQALIDEAETLQADYDRLRAAGKIAAIDFMEGR